MTNVQFLPYIELEFRLGSLNKTFDTNIGLERYTKIKNALDAYKNWTSTETANITDTFYNSIRHSLNKNTNETLVIQKKKLRHELLKLKNFDVKMSLCQEKPKVLENTHATFQREKTRISYITNNWKIDLTIIDNSKAYECELEFNPHYVKVHSLEFLKKEALRQLQNLISCANI